MHKFIRWYNQNRTIFFIGVAIIVFAFIIIQTLNAIVGEKNEQKKNNINLEDSSTNQSTTISEPDTSVITGETISNTQSKTNTEVIKEFLEYCNNGEIEKAYNMLTEECKELIYPSIQHFTANYYKKIFTMNRMYNLENWYSSNDWYTYYITYTEDVLASGNTNSENNKGDYITIVKTDNEYKLNISSYVGRVNVNETETSEGISITVNWIDMYIDYTILNISATNNTKNVITLDTKDNAETLYLYDTKNIKYTSFLNEIADEQLVVRRGATNNINIKFNKIYNTSRQLEGVTFSDIVLDYENYNLNGKDKATIKVEW